VPHKNGLHTQNLIVFTSLLIVNNPFIFQLAVQVTFNTVAQSCNMVDISR